MKVTKLQLTKPVLIGTKTEEFIAPGSEVFRLYDVEYDVSARLFKVTNKSDKAVPSLLIPVENVSSFSVSEDKKTEAPTKKAPVNVSSSKKE